MKKYVLLALLAGFTANVDGSYYPGYISQGNDQVAYQSTYQYSPDRYDTNGYSYYQQGDNSGYIQGGGYDQHYYPNDNQRYYYQGSVSYPNWNDTEANRYYQGGGTSDRDWRGDQYHYNQGGGYYNPNDSYNQGPGTIRVETQRTSPNYYYNQTDGSRKTLDEQNREQGVYIRGGGYDSSNPSTTRKSDSYYYHNDSSDRTLDEQNKSQGLYRQGGGSDVNTPSTIRRSDSRNTEGTTTITPGKLVDNRDSRSSTQSATKVKDNYQTESDREIAKKIRSKIGDGWFTKGYGDFSIDVNNGAVTLRGTLDKAEDKAKITDIVRKIDGVKSVNNQLVEAGSRTSNY